MHICITRDNLRKNEISYTTIRQYLYPPQTKILATPLEPGKETYHDCSSYRTISITDMFGKRLERIIAARLVCQLEDEGFDEYQFAYIKRRRSTQAVLSLVEAVKSNMLRGNATGVPVVFFDPCRYIDI